MIYVYIYIIHIYIYIFARTLTNSGGGKAGEDHKPLWSGANLRRFWQTARFLPFSPCLGPLKPLTNHVLGQAPLSSSFLWSYLLWLRC